MQVTFKHKIVAAMLVLGCMLAPAAQALNIAVLDANEVINQTNAAKRAIDQLTKKRDAAQQRIQKMETTFTEQKRKLEDQSSVMNAEQLNTAQADLRKDFLKFRAEAQSIQEELDRENLTLRKTIADTVRTVVEQMAKERKYDVVLPKNLLFYSTDAVDISNEVLKRANAALDK